MEKAVVFEEFGGPEVLHLVDLGRCRRAGIRKAPERDSKWGRCPALWSAGHAAHSDIPVRHLNSGLADGSLRPTIARMLPRSQIVDAHRFLESGEQIGRVVVNVA